MEEPYTTFSTGFFKCVKHSNIKDYTQSPPIAGGSAPWTRDTMASRLNIEVVPNLTYKFIEIKCLCTIKECTRNKT